MSPEFGAARRRWQGWAAGVVEELTSRLTGAAHGFVDSSRKGLNR